MVQPVFGFQVTSEFGNPVPVGPFALGQLEYFTRDSLQGFAVLALGVNFAQFDVHRDAAGVVAHGLFQDFFRLKIAAVGQVHIGFCHGVHVTACIQLAGRVGHGRPGGHVTVGGVYALAAAGAKERVGLNAAFEEGAVHSAVLATALDQTVGAKSEQTRHQDTAADGQQRVVHECGQEAGLFRRRGGRLGSRRWRGRWRGGRGGGSNLRCRGGL